MSYEIRLLFRVSALIAADALEAMSLLLAGMVAGLNGRDAMIFQSLFGRKKRKKRTEHARHGRSLDITQQDELFYLAKNAKTLALHGVRHHRRGQCRLREG